MGNVNIDWTIPNGVVSGDKLNHAQASAVLQRRLGEMSGARAFVIADLLRVIPAELWRKGTLDTLELSPFLAALSKATVDGPGTVNGKPIAHDYAGGRTVDMKDYREALSAAGDRTHDADALESAIRLKFPNISDTDLTKVMTQSWQAADADTTVRTRYNTLEDFTPLVERLTAGQSYGGAVVVDSTGAVTSLGGSSGNSFMDSVNGAGAAAQQPGEGMTEADMRSAYSTGELQWNQIREAVANGTANPMVQTGFPNQIEGSGAVGPMAPNALGPVNGAVGAPQRMPYGFGGRMSLLDAAQQISLRTPAEIATMQRRMAAAGYFGDEGTIAGAAYRPGVADDATRAAWTKVIQEAWYGGTSVTKVLAGAQNAMEARRAMLEKGAQVSDPQAFHLLANQIGNNVIGRDLTPSEQIYVRTRVLELERQQRAAAAEGRQSFEVNQEAQIEDWLVKFAPGEAQANEMFGQAFDLARATGRPLKLANPPSNEMIAQYLMTGQRNNWTLDRVLQQIFMDAGEGVVDGG